MLRILITEQAHRHVTYRKSPHSNTRRRYSHGIRRKVTVKGPKGTLEQTVHSDLSVKVEDGHVIVTRPTDDREHRAQHGLWRALIHNMVVGVSEGYRKEMELVGVGYRATATGQVLELALGYSHAIYIKLPPR